MRAAVSRLDNAGRIGVPAGWISDDTPSPTATAMVLAHPLGRYPPIAWPVAPLLARMWCDQVELAVGHLAACDPFVTPDLFGVRIEASAEVTGKLLDGIIPVTALPAATPERIDHARPQVHQDLGGAGRHRRAGTQILQGLVFGPRHRYSVDDIARSMAARSPIPDIGESSLGSMVFISSPMIAPPPPDPAPAEHPVLPEPASPPAAARTAGQSPDRSFRSARLTGRSRPVSMAVPGDRGTYLLGAPGASLKDPAKYVLHVMCAVLSGHGGQLDQRLRSRRALTYSLAFFSREFSEGGYLAGIFQCQPADLEEVRRQVLTSLSVLNAGLVDPGLLASAVEHVVVEHYRAGQSPIDRVMRMAAYRNAGVPLVSAQEYAGQVRAVTAPQIALAAELAAGQLAEAFLLPTDNQACRSAERRPET